MLAPPRAWLDAALERGKNKQAFVYYGAWMKEPGATASELTTLTERTEVIPNSLIVPIPSGERVGPGDIVLTAWASGTGMQRAIVVSGGRENSPRVRYLDMTLDNPSGWGKKEDTLPENTFVKLEKPGQLGTTAACKEDGHHMRYIVTQLTEQRILALGFAGKLRAFMKSDCRLLPPRIHVAKGDRIFAPLVGRYVEAHVRRVDKNLGRVWARHRSRDELGESAFAIIDVAKSLD